MGGAGLEGFYYVLEIVSILMVGLYAGVSGIVKVTLFVQRLLVRRRRNGHAPARAAGDDDDGGLIGDARDAQTGALRELEKAFRQHDKNDNTRFDAVNGKLDHHAEILGEIRDSISRIEGHLGIWPGAGPGNRRRVDGAKP